MFVWNFYTNDARVKRECTALSEAGYDVNLIALKKPKDKTVNNFQKINENFKVSRILKQSFVLKFLNEYKSLSILTVIFINFLLLTLSFLKKIIALLFIFLICLEIILIIGKKIRTFLIKLSTIIRMTLQGYKKNTTIFHANDLNTLPQAIICAKFRFKKKKLVYDSHEVQTDRTGYNGKLVKPIEKFLLKFVDCMIVENETRAQYNLELYGFRPSVVHNYSEFYNIDNFSNANIHQILDIDSKEKILLYQGGIQKGRGLDKLIEAMEFIKEGHLVFIGDGKEKNFLKKKAKNSKEKKRIHFIDKISLDNLPSYTKEAFIGFQVLQNVCFNHYSASSNKLFEYIMGGIPVIACDFPEISKVVRKNEIGIVINSHDCKEIASAVNKLIDNNILYQTFKNNTIHTRKLYNWEKEKINLLNLYSNLLN